MDTFSWLLVGHMVGDWLLQSDWMAIHKRKGLFTLAGFIHFTIYTVFIMVPFWLSDDMVRPPEFYAGVAVFVFVTHWFVDTTDVVQYWMKFWGQTQEFVRILVDQTFHLLVLAFICGIL